MFTLCGAWPAFGAGLRVKHAPRPSGFAAGIAVFAAELWVKHAHPASKKAMRYAIVVATATLSLHLV